MRSILRSMRNEYYIWKACRWVYKNQKFRSCEEADCCRRMRALAAEGEFEGKRNDKKMTPKKARFLFLATERKYIDQWVCHRQKKTCTHLQDKGLDITNHILFIPTGLIKAVVKENKILVAILTAAIIGALSELSVLSLVRSIADKI